ncbi:2-oxopent-4-enoate/cis-2-oxohex-4-enoate hydratase [Nitrospirillum amazonense]|uniref:2-oxopent-4-enoate/cis-2-oxohex-4-enoate hydratase n=1 Tax=Nitrospirillum amazonense TaxID=28077 RepID=A0A560F9W6_9PROT|nr:fumarylacetoacetate hydrolase family protein [Nitrospirillum amazonense]TWB18411.1 2-oxopent-4-enoate/cis-2-oxohex-4-enoate hydratase [Nitrospirillum amazonense]TWB66068.1 2-oxopent-4-enoate/cis-2-oxohex-4-enoate hydratase [Nitrospirillum amazonense]
MSSTSSRTENCPAEPAPADLVERLAQELYGALRGRRTLAPLIARHPSLTIEDAYRISLATLRRREADGEHVVGKKIGVTSKAVQDMLGVFQPDFGFLTDRMIVADGAVVDIAGAGLIQPRAEAEIAFILKRDLRGPGVTPEDVLDATEAVVPCFEIVDSRIQDWRIGIVDTVADNASCGVCVLGAARVPPRALDLPAVRVVVEKNGAFLSEGYGSAVQGSPQAAVAWLANTLGGFGVSLKAGEIVLSGSLVPLEPARPGDHFAMTLDGIGTASITFK